MNIIVKLFSALASLGAGFFANKIVDAAWTKATGDKPPKDPGDPESTLRSVLVFAVVSATVGAILQTLITHGTGKALLKRGDTPRDLS